MDNLRVMAWIFLAVFLGFLVYVGVWAGKKNKSGDSGAEVEYFLGGKSTPLIVLAMSYAASAVSAGSFIGDPGMMSTIGWPYFWLVVGVVPGLVLPGYIVIRKMRVQSEKYGSLTLTEYLGDRYRSPFLKYYLTIVITVCFLFMLVSQFKGAAALLETYTGIPFKVGLVIMMAVVLFYVNTGGLRSVAWTDFFQGCFMTVMCVMLVVVAIYKVGGLNSLEATLADKWPEALYIVEEGSTQADGTVVGWMGIASLVTWGCTIMFCAPHITSRYLALPTVHKTDVAKFSMISMVTGFLFNLMFIVGLCGRVLFPDAEADYMTVTMSTKLLPSILACVCMIGFFSAIISTATSILLVIGQSIGRDLYGGLSKNATPEKQVRVTQIATTVCTLIVFLFNMVKPPAFLQIFIYLGLSGIGSAVFMPLYGGVLTKKSTKLAAILSAIAGPAMYVIWTVPMGLSWVSGMGVGPLAAFIVYVVVTWIENAVKGPDQVMIDWADGFKDVDPDDPYMAKKLAR